MARHTSTGKTEAKIAFSKFNWLKVNIFLKVKKITKSSQKKLGPGSGGGASPHNRHKLAFSKFTKCVLTSE